MSKPIVSVLTTVYNRERFLPACIESVLAQQFEDFELIVVDDGSTDNSVAIARDYERRDARVCVHVNESNLGDYPNRNRAASLAQGKYLKYVDADDLIYPHCLQVMTEGMDEFHSAAWGCSMEFAGWQAPVELSPREAYRAHFLRDISPFGAGPLGTIVRKQAFEQAGGFDERRNTGDFRMWLSLSQRGSVVILQPGLTWWRRHGGQESALLYTGDSAAASFALRYSLFSLLSLQAPDCPLPPDEKIDALARIRREFARRLLRCLTHCALNSARSARREAGVGWGILASAFRRAPPSPHIPPLAPKRPSRPVDLAGKPYAVCARSEPSRAPLVSVLIPARNAEATLDETIACVLAQTFSDWELIVVDDASDDGTVKIAMSYTADPRVRVVCNPAPLGKWQNHNRCAAQARGAYLKFLHADDTLYPSCLSTMLGHMALYPSAGMLQSHEVNRLLVPRRMTPRDVFIQECFGMVTLWESPTGTMYRRSAWDAANGFNAAEPHPEACCHLRMARRSDVALTYAGLACYRRGSRQRRHFETGPDDYSDAMIRWLSAELDRGDTPLSDAERVEAKNVLSHISRDRKSWYAAGSANGQCRGSLFAWDALYPDYEAASASPAPAPSHCAPSQHSAA